MSFQPIKNRRDIFSFLDASNGLHDGFIVSVGYEHAGFTWGNPMLVDPSKAVLTLRIMVTSIHNTLVELRFEGVHEWQLKNDPSGLPEAAVWFTPRGLVAWCSDATASPDLLRDADYVLAEDLRWRIVPPKS